MVTMNKIKQNNKQISPQNVVKQARLQSSIVDRKKQDIDVELEYGDRANNFRSRVARASEVEYGNILD
jgi:hypothetical protein